MAEETFFGYEDIGEKGFAKWSLDYTMDSVIECFLAIPEAQRYQTVLGKIHAPCVILGHIALNEELLIEGLAQGNGTFRCPFPNHLFDVHQSTTEAELREGIPDSEQLVAYWREVRESTQRYLAGLTPEVLRQRPKKSILPEGNGNRDNPVREFFIMAIQHQNCHWGELRAICKILDVPIPW